MPPKKKLPTETAEPDVDVNGVVLPMRLSDKLKLVGACFEVDHQNADNKLRDELERLRHEKNENEEKAKKVIAEMTEMLEKQIRAVDESSKLLHDLRLDSEIAMEKWEKEKAFLEELIADQIKEAQTLDAKIRKEFVGKCFAKFHGGLTGTSRMDCNLAELVVLLTSLTRLDPTTLPPDGYAFFMPATLDWVIRNAQRTSSKIEAQLMGCLLGDPELMKKISDERLRIGDVRLTAKPPKSEDADPKP